VERSPRKNKFSVKETSSNLEKIIILGAKDFSGKTKFTFKLGPVELWCSNGLTVPDL
jgi:hypothetical protein